MSSPRILLIVMAGSLTLSAGFGAAELGQSTRNPHSQRGRTIFVRPSDSPETINQRIATLVAGDALIFRNGTYPLSNKLVLKNLAGTEQKPITIRAESFGQVILDGGNNFDINMFEIYNCRHLVLEGLELRGIDDGISLRQRNEHIVLQDLHIHHVGNVGIGAQGSDVDLGYLTVRGCHIHHTGISGGTGEGLYLGHHGTMKGIVHHALIEKNYIHHTKGGSQGDGIEFKHGSYANIIQDNVLHDVGPGITDYITGRNNPAEVNIIRRNVIWNADDFGIWSAGESLIENNIIFDVRDSIGIFIKQNAELPGYGVRDLTIRNNTVLDVCCGPSNPALRVSAAQSNVLVANNAFYQSSSKNYAIRLDVPLSNIALWKKNYFTGQLAGLKEGPDTVRGQPPSREFLNSTPVAGVIDLYPCGTSSLRSAADPSTLPADDFNRNQRPNRGAGEVGAYYFSGPANLGWKIQPGFKQTM